MTERADLITSTEAGIILGKSARTIQRMTDKGLLVGVMKLPGPNGAVLYDRAEVEEYAARVQPPVAS